MEMTSTRTVIVDGEARDYPLGTPYQAIAADVQDRYPSDILLVDRDGKLCELNKPLDRDCTLRMLTAADRPGRQTYERSVVFLMLAAFYDTVGAERVRRVSVEYSISRALFIRVKGDFSLDQALLDRVEERMRQLVRQAVPIRKTSLSTEDAIELFRSRGMPDKAQLLSFRISSRVNVYSLEDFSDYFYGYMVPDTSYLKWFALQIFEDGFVLRLPDLRDPCRLRAFTPPIKVFQALHDAALRSEALHISNVAEMNQRISQGGATQMILSQEALMAVSYTHLTLPTN